MTKKVSTETATWFLRVSGQKMGPFTTDQVRGLIDEGEVHLTNHISTTPDDEGPWLELLAWQRARSTSTKSKGRFEAPLRPSHLGGPEEEALESELNPAVHQSTRAITSDPMNQLFETFQNVKEKQKNLAPDPHLAESQATAEAGFSQWLDDKLNSMDFPIKKEWLLGILVLGGGFFAGAIFGVLSPKPPAAVSDVNRSESVPSTLPAPASGPTAAPSNQLLPGKAPQPMIDAKRSAAASSRANAANQTNNAAKPANLSAVPAPRITGAPKLPKFGLGTDRPSNAVGKGPSGENDMDQHFTDMEDASMNGDPAMDGGDPFNNDGLENPGGLGQPRFDPAAGENR